MRLTKELPQTEFTTQVDALLNNQGNFGEAVSGHVKKGQRIEGLCHRSDG